LLFACDACLKDFVTQNEVLDFVNFDGEEEGFVEWEVNDGAYCFELFPLAKLENGGVCICYLCEAGSEGEIIYVV
jgi:hypothetical protein